MSLCGEEEGKDAVIAELAGIIPKYVEEKLQKISQKRKRELLVVDYNMALVTYVLPVMNYGEQRIMGKPFRKKL